MQDRWYGDKRDLVKWTILITLCHERRIPTILWVAFYRPEKQRPQVKLEMRSLPIPNEVWDHFRDIHRIHGLAERSNLRVEIIDTDWDGDRDAYISKVVSRLTERSGKPTLVFLDPDTGIAGQNAKSPEHVHPSELKRIFQAMRSGDWLVFYQHARRQKGWEKSTHEAFTRELVGLLQEDVWTASSEIAKDVIFFVAQRA